MAYPSSIDTFSGTTAQGTSLQSSPDHALDHRTLGSALGTVEQVIGTTAGTAILMNFTAGQFAARTSAETFGTSTWIGGTIGTALIGTSTVQGGTINSAAIQGTSQIGTAMIRGGTVGTAVIGTSTIQGGTANNQVVGTPLITGGTINGAVLGTPTITPSISPVFAGTTITADATTASTNYVAVVGGTVVITPNVSSNIMIQFSGEWRNGGANFNYLQIMKNGTALASNTDHQADISAMQKVDMTYVDPAVAGGFVGTYSIQWKVDAGTATIAGAAAGGQNSRLYAFAFPV